MVGIVMGHGSFDGPEVVTVPQGLPVEFFTDEGSALLLVNLLELLKRNHHRTPMHVAAPGSTVLNYWYKPFNPVQLRAVDAFNELDLPRILVGSGSQPTALRLCADPAKCPKDGPHTCTGVFGQAARKGWTKLLVVACRIDDHKPQAPTVALATPSGGRDTSAYDALHTWVTRFVAMSPAEQDAAWRALPERDRIRYTAVEEEVREWLECLELRTAIATSTNPTALIESADRELRIRLVRDYPEHRAAAIAGITLTPEERHANAEFLLRPLADQFEEWGSLSLEDQVRAMADPDVTAWTTALNALILFDHNLDAPHLATILRRLTPAARATTLQEPRLVDYLSTHGITL
ncbi:putative adhesin [Actinokineospora globicatena]|uniref:putative adhesin n=1 Tax=Actinokineospora globicatena TaxID=103729 RepID=UPI0020A55525|nr:hypothetical protein [Actinokineospora globicatena]MCP2302993.1 hypothetical protein [Actinokineospora globicatena]GLW79900.1 hypothetical protein Aglo01_43810 [Actinokineospora globicatena]GLW85690.1 hypothetical protein Aglo02_33300 [Actinokineospora globicatena]